jgi:hypothetical protein
MQVEAVVLFLVYQAVELVVLQLAVMEVLLQQEGMVLRIVEQVAEAVAAAILAVTGEVEL